MPSFLSTVGGWFRRGNKKPPKPRKPPPTPPPGECPHSDFSKGRNLVISIDGTANQFGLKNSQVVELNSLLMHFEGQGTYYSSGIGTYVKSKRTLRYWMQAVDHGVDLAIATHFKESVLKAYEWLSENYRPGDRIYLFGFSRGAYQVRVIAGMIAKVGLLHKGNNQQIPFAYDLYRSTTSHAEGREWFPDSDRKGKKKAAEPAVDESDATPEDGRQANPEDEDLCKHFRDTFSHPDVKVHFVGVWDTVSSVGTARGPTLPETTNGMRHVCAFRHALALDERRVKFLPEFANGGHGPPPPPKEERRREDAVVSEGVVDGGGVASTAQKKATRILVCGVKEVWLVGTHSDIGGGNLPNLLRDHFGPALRWILYEAIHWGLRTHPFRKGWRPVKVTPSMTGLYPLLEYYPWKRLSYRADQKPEHTIRLPLHNSAPRAVVKGQLIHESVLHYMKANPNYVPLALENASGDCGIQWRKGMSVDELRTELEAARMLEKDPYLSAQHLTEKLKDSEFADEDANVWSTLTSSELGLRSFQEDPRALASLFDELKTTSEQMAVDEEKTARIIKALSSFESAPLTAEKYFLGDLRKWTACVGDELPDQVAKVIQVFGSYIEKSLKGHTRPVQSVAISPNGQQIVSGSWDHTIARWNIDTGKPIGDPLTGHEDSVNSVAFSPDGSRIASGSDDHTIQIWDVATGKPIGSPLQGHTSFVYSVAFSPDPEGQYIASGSWDYTVRIWNSTSGECIRTLQGHTSHVWSVAFSPDGKRIVSGSYDHTVRIWDVETGECIGSPLEGHSGYVFSVSFSPDGTRIVSGSEDGTIRIWNADTREPIGSPLTGHSNLVMYVIFSPSGRCIVSGSSDGSVRIWDSGLGKCIGMPLEESRSHRVWPVAFSSYGGGRIVAGTNKGEIIILCMEPDWL